MTDMLLQRVNSESERDVCRGRRPHEDEDRDGGAASVIQEAHEIPGCRPERGTEAPSQSPKGTSPACLVTWDFQAPQVGDDTFLLFQPAGLRYFVLC